MIEYLAIQHLSPWVAFIAGMLVSFFTRLFAVWLSKKLKEKKKVEAEGLQRLTWEHITYKEIYISIAKVHEYCFELRVRKHAQYLEDAIYKTVCASREQCITVGEAWIDDNIWKEGYTI